MALRLFRRKKKVENEPEDRSHSPSPEGSEENTASTIVSPEQQENIPSQETLTDKDLPDENKGADITEEEPLPDEEHEEASETSRRGFLGRFRKKKTAIDQKEEHEAASDDKDLSDEGQKDPDVDETEEPGEALVVQEKTKKGLFKRLRNRLSKTRKALVNRVDGLLLGKKEIDEELLEELEEILITSDLGIHTTMALIDEVREQVARKDLNNSEELKEALQKKIASFLQIPSEVTEPIPPEKPHVIMVVGVNGVGKTTTIGKLAAKHIEKKKRVLLVAADTFRAAAVEQLEIWSERVGAEIVRHKGKADPSAVAFDGMQAAISRDVDVVIIDTAGRLHTKVNLMEELKKISRTVAKHLPHAPPRDPAGIRRHHGTKRHLSGEAFP